MVSSFFRQIFSVAILQSLISANSSAQEVSAVRFETFRIASDFSVHFEPFSFAADEIWFVEGACEGVFGAAKIIVEQFAFAADLKVHLTSASIAADRKVCLANPDDAPAEFWAAYEQR